MFNYTYGPSDEDWEKIINYVNDKRNIAKLGASCKSIKRMIDTYIITRAIGAQEYEKYLACKLRDNDMSDEQIEELYNHYGGIPEEWEDYVEDLKNNSDKGGLATVKYIDPNLSSVDLKVRDLLNIHSRIKRYYMTNSDIQQLSEYTKLTVVYSTMETRDFYFNKGNYGRSSLDHKKLNYHVFYEVTPRKYETYIEKNGKYFQGICVYDEFYLVENIILKKTEIN